MRCAAPLPAGVLLDYWTGDLPSPRAEELEAHVFECHACTRRLAEVEALASAVRRLTARGRFTAAVAPSLVDLLAARGLRVRTFRPRHGETIPCGAAPEDELLVSRIALDLGEVARVDIVLCDERGAEQGRQADIPFDRARGEIAIAQRVDDPGLRVPAVLRFRLLAVGAGGERTLGEYAMAHDPGGPPVA